MREPADCLLQVLQTPSQATGLDETEWRELVRVARALNLLGLLGERAHAAGLEMPFAVWRHLDGARQLSARQRLSVAWEVQCLQDVLGELSVPVLLLKGSAYVMSGHRVSHGRLFGDIDILVPRGALPEVESLLQLSGWVATKTDEYDQRYYRQWMHELPPLQNLRRGTVLDIHHTILPLTARNCPDPARIIGRAKALPGLGCIHVPSAEDLVVHSLVHLVHEGELHNGLRDLADIDGLVQDFARQPAFWSRFESVAVGNDLAGPVLFGLRLLREFFATPVPESVLTALQASLGRSALSAPVLTALYARALRAYARPTTGLSDALAQLFVYVRAHGLRMPLPMLASHLGRKSWMSLTKSDQAA